MTESGKAVSPTKDSELAGWLSREVRSLFSVSHLPDIVDDWFAAAWSASWGRSVLL